MREAVWAVLLLAIAVPASADTVLRARLNADIVGSDPRGRRDANTDALLLHLVEGLVASREDGSIGPMLASGWTVSADRRTYRFALRHDVSFHNGARFTSADVVWSFNRYLAPDSHWRCKPDLGPRGIAHLQSVKATGPFSLEIVLGQPAPLFLKTLARADCGGTGILQKASVDASGAWRFPVGTGPFRWGGWVRNQHVDLLRYAGYRSLPGPSDGNGGGKHVLVDRVRFEVIPDGSAASAALIRGSLDIVDGLAPNELAGIRGVPGIRFSSSPGMDFYGVLFQTRDRLLADPRLRRAIALSIDVAGLTRVATHGTATPDSSPVAAASPFFGPKQRPLIAKNLRLARALVRASGYRGQTITLITSHAPPEMFDDAILVQAMAREAGISIQIVTLDWASQLVRYQRGDYQAILFGFSPRLDPAFTYGTIIGDKSSDPRKIWDSPAAQALYQKSLDVEGSNERQHVFDDLETLFRRDAPAVILYNTQRVTALRSDVFGFKSWPAQIQRLWGVGLRAR
jgi:peptide/nickel transport system substrate-binding protein